jgi:hypothetical protein
MANSAVLFGDGKEADASVIKETIDAIKQGRDIFAEVVGLVRDIRDEAQSVARDLDKWVSGRNDPDPNSEVIIWRHRDFGTPSRGFRMGETVTNYQNIHYNLPLYSENWNDEVSSVKVSGSAVFVIWEHASFGGNRLVLLPGTSIPFLGHVAGGWNDKVSSSKVIQVTELDQIFP